MAKFEMKAEVKMHGIFLTDPPRAIRIFEEEFKKALEESSALIQRDLIRGTQVHTSNLRNSIFREIRGRGISLHAIIGTPVVYANFIETGNPAHFPNVENIKGWVRLKLGVTGQALDKLTFIIARRMSVRGLKKAHFMFRNAFLKGKLKAQSILDKSARRIVERWGK